MDDSQRCHSTAEVEFGLYKVTLQCIHARSMHPGHGTARRFGDVSVYATWPGKFEKKKGD